MSEKLSLWKWEFFHIVMELCSPGCVRGTQHNARPISSFSPITRNFLEVKSGENYYCCWDRFRYITTNLKKIKGVLATRNYIYIDWQSYYKLLVFWPQMTNRIRLLLLLLHYVVIFVIVTNILWYILLLHSYYEFEILNGFWVVGFFFVCTHCTLIKEGEKNETEIGSINS